MSMLNSESDLMHRQVSAALKSDPDAAYRADYAVDAAIMVSALVPQGNRLAMEEHPWLKHVVISFATAELKGFDLGDPAYVVERCGLASPVAYSLDEAREVVPSNYDCSFCGVLGFVRPARFANSARVVELLLCGPCVEHLGVVTS